MAKYSPEAKLEQAEISAKICKSNIENQKKKLEEIKTKIAKIQRTLKEGNVNSSPSNERENLINLGNNLKIHAIRQQGLIDELENELKIAEDKLSYMRFNCSTIKL